MTMCNVKEAFAGLNWNAMHLLLYIMLNADENGCICMSERQLADALGKGRQEIRTAKQALLTTKRITQTTTQSKTILTLCCCGGCDNVKTKQKPKAQPKDQPTIAPVWVAQEYVSVFLDWIEYKKSRREGYKNEKSMRACYNLLVKLSGNNPDVARMVVEQSMANNWKGLFPIKENHNGTNWRNNGRDDELAAQAIRMRSQFEAERNSQ